MSVPDTSELTEEQRNNISHFLIFYLFNTIAMQNPCPNPRIVSRRTDGEDVPSNTEKTYFLDNQLVFF